MFNITIMTGADIISSLLINQLLKTTKGCFFTIIIGDPLTNLQPCPSQIISYFEKELPFKYIDYFYNKSENASGYKTFDQMENVIHIDSMNINSKEGIALLQSTKPDLILNIRYLGIFKAPEIFHLAKFGIVNTHPGLLPRYRGRYVTMHKLMEQEKFTGFTLHYINNSEIDTGDIIKQSIINLDLNKSYIGNLIAMSDAFYPDLLQFIEDLTRGIQPISQKQEHSKARYFSKPAQDEIENFKNSGYQFFVINDLFEIIIRYIPNFKKSRLIDIKLIEPPLK